MDNYNELTLKQENAILKRLNGETKKEYYVAVFTSHLISSLREARKSMGINQDEIAKRTGLKQSYISKIENLEKTPTIETIAKYCYALNFSFESLESLINVFLLNKEEIGNLNFCRRVVPEQTNKSVIKAVF